MIRIVLDDNQAQSFRSSDGSVEFCDREGNFLGHLSRKPSDEDVQEASLRLESDGPWHSTQQVLDHLSSLERE